MALKKAFNKAAFAPLQQDLNTLPESKNGKNAVQNPENARIHEFKCSNGFTYILIVYNIYGKCFKTF